MSYTFCCCLPVRFGSAVLSLLTGIASALISIGTFVSLHKQGNSLHGAEKAALIVAGVVWGILFFISVFGFLGTLSARRTYVLVYSRMLWIHWFIVAFVGAILIWNLFRKDFHETFVQNCEAKDPVNNTQPICEARLSLARGIYIGVFVAIQLIDLYGCVIVSRYVKQLTSEVDHKAIRKMENSLANMSYAYSNQQNSLGSAAGPSSKA